MNAERFNRCWTWIGVGAVVGYFVPFLIGSLAILYGLWRDGDFKADVLWWWLPVMFLVYTALGVWISYSILGSGCGLVCACLLPQVGRWRRLAALTALVLLASIAASALHCRWFGVLWPS